MTERLTNPGSEDGEWYGTQDEFDRLQQLLAHDQEFATKTTIYLTDLFNGKGEEGVKKYNAFLEQIDFDGLGLSDALGDWLDGRRK